MFEHNLLPREDLRAITNEKERKYITPIGQLPSVTTIIGQAMDKSGLKKWRDNVGNDAADQILQQARNRGRAIHDLCERYVLNDPDYSQGAMPVNIETFRQFKAILDENIETVYGIELPLWSKVLQTAGTADMVAKWSGKNAIIDYKTALRPKTEEQCLGYLLQGTVYACMMYERYRMNVPLVVVLLAVDHVKEPVIYAVPTSKYYDQAHNIFITNRKLEYENV